MLYIHSKITVMAMKEEKLTTNPKAIDPKKSIQRGRKVRRKSHEWVMVTPSGAFSWRNRLERVTIIRKGLPYDSIEVIGQKADLPVKRMLYYLGIAQTTYNKKKREKDHLSGRDSEIILVLSEVLDFGLEVFNNEREKFHRWLKKPNLSLGGVEPESLFDSFSGIQEVRNVLNRLEYGNMT